MPAPDVTARYLEMLMRTALPVGGPAVLHPRQWAILRHLAEANPKVQSIGEIARCLGVTHSPASRAIAALARDGLVRIIADVSDHRAKHVELTSGGEQLLEGDPIRRLSAAIDELDLTQRRRFAGILSLLHNKLRGE